MKKKQKPKGPGGAPRKYDAADVTSLMVHNFPILLHNSIKKMAESRQVSIRDLIVHTLEKEIFLNNSR